MTASHRLTDLGMESRRPPGRGIAWVSPFFHTLSAVLVLLVAVSMAGQPYPALMDYVEWMYQGWIVAQIFQGEATIISGYVFADYPIPNSLSQIALGLLNLVFRPAVASLVWIWVYLAGFFWITWVLSRRVAPTISGALQFVLLLVFCFGSVFWNGYINYCYSLLIFSIFVQYYLVEKYSNPVVLFIFSVFLFFTHAATLMVFGLVIVVRECTGEDGFRPPRISAFFALVPSGILFLWYLYRAMGVPGSVRPDDASLSPVFWFAYKAYTLAKQGPFHNFVLGEGTDFLVDQPAIYWAGVGINFVVVALLAIWCLMVAVKIGRNFGRYRFEAIVLGFLIVVFLAMPPFMILGNPGERLIIPGLLLLFVLFPPHRRTLYAWGACGAICLPYLAVVLFSLWGHTVEIYASPGRERGGNDGFVGYAQSFYSDLDHKYFNHRLYQFADRGAFILDPDPANAPPISFRTSIVQPR